ncbi:MAG: adenylyltransferase/cytidyltransferase family protein [Chloroflexota bacterium]|nr:adenylyltransferase/cytidyltransferase family protein [Chloroflexota bacterium]
MAEAAAPTPQIFDRTLEAARSHGRIIVLTNGCFDVMHAGHAAVLRAAAAEGDFLAVGVNDDAGVRALKGPGRPMAPLADRLALVAAVRWVDAITVLEEPTADALIERVRPNVYVKGADYDPGAGGRDLPEAATLRALDVRVVYVPLLSGRSTSEFIERLRLEP